MWVQNALEWEDSDYVILDAVFEVTRSEPVFSALQTISWRWLNDLICKWFYVVEFILINDHSLANVASKGISREVSSSLTVLGNLIV